MSIETDAVAEGTDTWSTLSRCDPEDADDLVETLVSVLDSLGELEDDRILDDFLDIDATVAAFGHGTDKQGIRTIQFDCRVHTVRISRNGTVEVKQREQSTPQ